MLTKLKKIHNLWKYLSNLSGVFEIYINYIDDLIRSFCSQLFLNTSLFIALDQAKLYLSRCNALTDTVSRDCGIKTGEFHTQQFPQLITHNN